MWLYLENRNILPTYSAWMGSFYYFELISKRLMQYYMLNNKYPDWVYIDESYTDKEYIDIYRGYTKIKLSKGILLKNNKGE